MLCYTHVLWVHVHTPVHTETQIISLIKTQLISEDWLGRAEDWQNGRGMKEDYREENSFTVTCLVDSKAMRLSSVWGLER